MRIKSIGEHEFASEYPETLEDRSTGMDLAFHIGDTFVESGAAPSEQWTNIVKMLRVHGLKIVEIPDER